MQHSKMKQNAKGHEIQQVSDYLYFVFDLSGSQLGSLGSAYNCVRSMVVVEEILSTTGLNDVTSLGVGAHPLFPKIPTAQDELIS